MIRIPGLRKENVTCESYAVSERAVASGPFEEPCLDVRSNWGEGRYVLAWKGLVWRFATWERSDTWLPMCAMPW